MTDDYASLFEVDFSHLTLKFIIFARYVPERMFCTANIAVKIKRLSIEVEFNHNKLCNQ